MFEFEEGYFKAAENENVKEKLDSDRKISGLRLFNVSTFSVLPISINLHGTINQLKLSNFADVLHSDGLSH